MTDSDCTIRPPVADEADAVARLWSVMAEQHRAYDADVWCWSQDAVRHWRKKFIELLDGDDTIARVAADPDGELVGYALCKAKDSSPLYATRRTGEVWDLLVQPGRRRGGVGRRLMAAALEGLRGRGAEGAILHVALANTGAEAFYERLGMQAVMYRMYKRLATGGSAPARHAAQAAAARIRPARAEDTEPLSRLWGILAEQARSYPGRVWADHDRVVAQWRTRVAKEVDQPDMVVLVIEAENGRIVGFVEAQAEDSAPIFATRRTGEVWNVVIHPDHRRRGLGTRLMAAAFVQLRERGCDDAVLHVDICNRAAGRFYEKAGMRRVMSRMYRKL